MFNIAQKQQYIDYCLAVSKVSNPEKFRSDLLNFFNRLRREVEDEFNKDFALFSYNEMKTALSIFCKRTTKYQASTLSRLKSYLTWAIENNLSLDQENRLDGVKPKDIDTSISYKMTMIKDEEQLIEYLNQILKPTDEDSVDTMYRICFLLIFAGIPFEETMDLKLNAFDAKAQSVDFNGKMIRISQTLCSLIESTFRQDCYRTTGKNEEERKLKINKEGYILERTTTRDSMYASMMSRISVYFRTLKESLGYPISITVSDIWKSGVFNRAYLMEKETGKVDLSEYCISVNKNDTFTQSNILQEYEAWKNAFEL